MFHTKHYHGNTSPKRVCVSCKTPKERSDFAPGKRQCNDCAAASQTIRQKQITAWRRQHGAAAQRAWRERNPTYDSQYYQANRRRRIARSTLNRAIRLGKLPRAADCACAQCGQPAHEYHIADHTQPLAATPVCRACNRRINNDENT